MIFQILDSLNSELVFLDQEVGYGTLSILPEEIISFILSDLDPKSLSRLAQTSTTMNRLASQNQVRTIIIILSFF
jgi:hypothetical protein